jgi:hypothetical protein
MPRYTVSSPDDPRPTYSGRDPWKAMIAMCGHVNSRRNIVVIRDREGSRLTGAIARILRSISYVQFGTVLAVVVGVDRFDALFVGAVVMFVMSSSEELV